MPIRTPIYGLEAFTEGEEYSASTDQRRFLIIDNQLAYFTDIIGEGRIIGWEVTHFEPNEYRPLSLSISAGIGIIGRFVTFTYGDYEIDLDDNRTTYVYMKRKINVIGGFSGFSNMFTIIVSDVTPPSIPTGLSISSDYDKNILTWDGNIEPDFDHYDIYRSLDNITFTQLGTSETASYIDSGLNQDTIYYYRIRSIDQSDNVTVPCPPVLGKTIKDLRQPLPIGLLQSFDGNETLEVFWQSSATGDLLKYQVVVQELDKQFESVGSVVNYDVTTDKTFLVVNGLINETAYKLVVYAVSVNNVYSEGISIIKVPTYRLGPAEAEDIDISYSSGDNEDVNVVMNIDIIPPGDPYVIPPDRYYIVIVENGSDVSNPIVLTAGSLSQVIRTIPFTLSSGQIDNYSVKAETNYLVRVVGVDSNGLENNGIIVQTSSPTFRKPLPVYNIQSSQLDNNTILVIWRNNLSVVFSHNLVTIKRKDLISGVETTILNAENLEAAESYIIAASYVDASILFTFRIQTVDKYGNMSNVVVGTLQIDELDNIIKPSPPTGVRANSGDGSVELEWQAITDQTVVFINIWKGDFTLFPKASSFTKIAILPSNYTSFTDYEVKNDSRYMYFVTSTNLFGLESSNPYDTGYSVFSYVTAMPKEVNDLTEPTNLTVTQFGFDAELDWDSSTGVFDGFQIYRSIGNKYSFAAIASVSPDVVSYSDQDALLKNDQEVYYMVRKYRNEAEPYVTGSTAPPRDSIILAKIITTEGSVIIDKTVARELLNMEDPIIETTQMQINAHKHNIDEQGNDKRIDLQSAIVVSDWVTNDFQHYTTDIYIQGASVYLITVTGTINEEFYKDDVDNINYAGLEQAKKGTPPFLFEVDANGKEISFEYPLFLTTQSLQTTVPSNLDTTGSEAANQLFVASSFIRVDNNGNLILPYISEPIITLKLLGITEVQGTLSRSRVESLSATQVESNTIDPRQIPLINHQGRIFEKLIPTQNEMISTNKFTYKFYDTLITMSSTETFYDFLLVSDNTILSATSLGVRLSNDFGSTWGTVLEPQTAPHKIFYAEVLDKYMVLTNDGVYVSSGDLTHWSRMSGMENVKVVRDIVEDNHGNLYCSTDLGVYRLDITTAKQYFSWLQTSLLGARSVESYALLYDDTMDRVLVSNELGILESHNHGITWSFTSEFDEFEKIFTFIQSMGFIFALTKNDVYRKTSSGNFSKVAEIDCNISRRIVLYKDELYVSTDMGVYASTGDIYTETDIYFHRVFPDLNVNGNIVPATTLNTIDTDHIFIGTDQRILVYKSGKVWLQYENSSGYVPSIYANSSIQLLGVYYFSPLNLVSFDEKQGVNAIIKTAVAYTEYQIQYRGWATQNYNARIQLIVNNLIVADSNNLSDGIQLDVNQFIGFQYPVFTESNSYYTGALAAKTTTQTDIKKLTDVLSGDSQLATGETLTNMITTIFNDVEKFYSLLYPEARILGALNDAGNIQFVMAEFPAIEVNLTSSSKVNISDGTFTFTNPYTKYDNLKVNIIGATLKNIGSNTHRDIEDVMELVNSGLPSSLSRVEQVNTTKLGVFNEKTWPQEQFFYATPYQSLYNVPYIQNWYDKINSSIDYKAYVTQDDSNPTIPYVAAAVLVPNSHKILVGGTGGAVLIDSQNLEIDPVIIDINRIVDIKFFYISKDNIIYAITTSDIYISVDGLIWTKFARDGLPNNLYTMGGLNNVLVIGAEDGIYFKTPTLDEWILVLSSTKIVEIVTSPDLLFALVDGANVYSSSDGATWSDLGTITTVQPNVIAKFKSITFVGTNKGLYKDDGTFYGSGIKISFIDVLGISFDSAALVINDIVADGDRLIVGLSDGRFLVFWNNVWTIVTTELDTIQKIVIADNRIWLFGYNLATIGEGSGSTIDMSGFAGSPIRISTGVPM